MTSTVLRTGSSSGIGKSTARLFRDKGWNVAATMRSPDKETELSNSQQMLTSLDVTDDASVARAVQDAISRFDEIDVVVNSAGYGLWGPSETGTPEQVRRLFDTNVIGLIAVTRTVLPHF